GTLYAPTGFVVVIAVTPVSIFVTETVALGTAAPSASAMVPDSVAPATCARNGPEIRRQSPRIQVKNRNLIVFGLICRILPFHLSASVIRNVFGSHYPRHVNVFKSGVFKSRRR